MIRITSCHECWGMFDGPNCKKYIEWITLPNGEMDWSREGFVPGCDCFEPVAPKDWTPACYQADGCPEALDDWTRGIGYPNCSDCPYRKKRE